MLYTGRVVAVARTLDGRVAALYRVSSRSFPNREALIKESTVCIVPKKGHELDIYKSPYIAYNCLRIAGDSAVVSNGSHTDPISERMAAGMPAREALSLILMALDYEHDQYNTSRIVATVQRKKSSGYLGIIREDGIGVGRVELAPGDCFYVSTYETNRLSRAQRCDFHVENAREGAEFVLSKEIFAEMSHPVTGVCALETADGFEIATAQAPAASA